MLIPPGGERSRHAAPVTSIGRTYDVVVVGAGPAGSSAAIELARAGRRVLLLDKATFPRDKCCGDGLTAGALRLLEHLGLQPASLPSWCPVDEIVMSDASRRENRYPLPRSGGLFAAVARRTELDAALVDLARSAGVEVLEGHACTGAAADADHVRLEVHDVGPVITRYVVGADGMWSPLRKYLGAHTPGYLGEWHAFRQYLTGVGPRAASELVVWFEPDLLPGYAWSFPLGGGAANVGFGVPRGGAVRTQDMKALWPDLLSRPHIRAVLGEGAVPEAAHKAWPIPARIAGTTLSAAGGRALFVGDAAAAADPLTGEGIGQALLTGSAAAAAIADAGALAPDRAAAAYAGAVRRELVPDAAMSTFLLRAFGAPARLGTALRIAGVTPWHRRNFARWLFEDYPRAYVITPGRWREHRLAGPGAFRDDGTVARPLAAS